LDRIEQAIKKLTSRQPLLVAGPSRTQSARKRSAAEMAGRGGVAAGEPSYMEGADGDDDDDAAGGAAAAA
jgi:hypothetical protein